MRERQLIQNAQRALIRRGKAILRLAQEYYGVRYGNTGEQSYRSFLNLVERRELGNIHKALARIAKGIYGQCVGCSKSLDRSRLLTEPSNLHCDSCAQ